MMDNANIASSSYDPLAAYSSSKSVGMSILQKANEIPAQAAEQLLQSVEQQSTSLQRQAPPPPRANPSNLGNTLDVMA